MMNNDDGENEVDFISLMILGFMGTLNLFSISIHLPTSRSIYSSNIDDTMCHKNTYLWCEILMKME